MMYLCIVSLFPSADDDQWHHFEEKMGEIAVAEVSIVRLQTGSAEKCFLVTYTDAYLKNQYLYAEFMIFFTALVCRQTAAYFGATFFSTIVPPCITTPSCFCCAPYRSAN